MASLAAGQTYPVASRFFCPAYGILHEQFTQPLPPVSVVNDDIVNIEPGQSAVGQGWHGNENHRADNLTLIFGYQKLISWKCANLRKDPPVIIWRRASSRLRLRGGYRQLS